MGLSKLIKERREKLGISQNKMAKDLSIPQSTIRDYENEKYKNHSSEKISKICKYLKIKCWCKFIN